MNLRDLISKLIANEKIIGLVKLMKPMDIFAVVSVDLGLQKGDAESVVANLLQHARHEGMASPGIETNKDYPVPARIRRDNEIEEDYVNNMGQMNPDISPDQFPPKPRSEPGEWPYDAMNVAGMDLKNKGRKRGLTSGKSNSGKVVKEREKFKGPFEPNLKFNQPGGDYGGSQGIYSKEPPHFNNSQSSSGRSYDSKGRPGWSSSPPGKEFESDIELNVSAPTRFKPGQVDDASPVGSAIPQFQGGHSQQRRMGFRRR